MDQAFATVLARYETRAAREAEMQRAGSSRTSTDRRDEYLLHVGEHVARILHALVVGHGSKCIVELGTSYGYSTLFLADAARATGGKLYTIEKSEAKQAYAREQLNQAGLADHVEWLCGDAVELLAGMEGPFDFVLLDIWKELYVPCLELFAKKMSRGGIVVADNMLQPAAFQPIAAQYQAKIRNSPGVLSALLPVGQGIEVSTFWSD